VIIKIKISAPDSHTVPYDSTSTRMLTNSSEGVLSSCIPYTDYAYCTLTMYTVH